MYIYLTYTIYIMEKHIFKFGESSLAMIVPKKWAEKRGLKPSSEIYASEDENGNLVISSSQMAKREVEKIVNPRMNPDLLARWVGIHYMYGASRIRILSQQGIPHALSDAIEAKVSRECPGFEITGQTNTELVIEDFTNMKEIDLDRIIGRIRSLVDQEIMEISTGNAKTIGKLEKLVNRFYMLGVRYIHITQPNDSIKYFTVLELLENTSDSLESLAPSGLQGAGGVLDGLRKLFSDSFKGLAGDEKAIESIEDQRGAVIKRINRLKADKLQVQSLKGIADNATKIAEFGLKAEKKKDEFTIPVKEK